MPVPYRGVWISFLDFSLLDFGSAAALAGTARRLFRQYQALSLNRAIVHLRPFADALYPSGLFPWSHLLGGRQGVDPGYDPLAVLLEEAGACGIAVEGWLNPYRITRGDLFAGSLADHHPARLHPEWTASWQQGLYFNPARPEVTQLIAAGAAELAARYPLAAIQFDDYFYPTTHPDFDQADYQQVGIHLSLEAWRRENVSGMVAAVYRAVKAANPAMAFGISPHGDDRLNVDQQYADTGRWLTQPGYIDYLMPQIYYGNTPTRQQQGQEYTFTACVAEWQARPRLAAVQLYFGVGAYLLQPGQEETLTGWLAHLEQQQAAGYVLFRAGCLPGFG